ncbi:hypothetical protein HID58_072942 [Brassica napus]|uniref:Transmembrane protein n=1 Tax=Brassica napus TaxID=3708 RepID=A0ABQ7Z5U6_BRANA|nr:hypothetical protein HID58_072942 [Brassica napus]
MDGTTEHTWQPTMSAETNIPSYWLNWRFFVCAVFILTSLFLSFFLIWKYEGPIKRKAGDQREPIGVVYDDETWNTCVARIHPNWLLGFRVFCFVVLLGLISGNAIAEGSSIFIFYTQLTFILVTIYFGLGALLSIYRYKSGENCLNGVSTTCAGAVLLTDGVFWFIIYPFLTSKDFSLNFFIVVMHSVNAVFLLGETFLNSLRFPLFRISYFVVWTGVFVLFQWIVHACVSFWWPYPFLDLSSPYAPLWYATQTHHPILFIGYEHQKVCCCWVDALTMLWIICFDREVEVLVALKCFSDEPYSIR